MAKPHLIIRIENEKHKAFIDKCKKKKVTKTEILTRAIDKFLTEK